MTAVIIAGSILLAILPFAFRAWGNHRYRQGRYDESIEQHERRIEHNRAASPGAHRQRQPRQTPGDAVAGDLSAIRPKPRRRLVTTAADLAPVILPQDAAVIPLRHQPAPSPERPTTAMPKLTDTGELRARTDERIMRMREDTEAWLAETRLT